MSTNDPKSLVSLYFDGALSPEDAVALCAWVNQSPANAEHFAREMIFHRRLYDILRGRNVVAIHDQEDSDPPEGDPRGMSTVMPAIVEETEPAEDDAITLPPAAARTLPAAHARRAIWAKGWSFAHWRWLAGAAGVGLAACIILALLPKQGPPARLTALAGAQWESGNPLALGSDLAAGQEVPLRAGTVELKFASGATVILLGPAEFHVSGRNAGTLDYGKLVARVPDPAHGFTVASSNLKITDLGTEFGLSVTQAGVARVEVFKGAVELTRPDQTAGIQPPVRLASHQAASCQVSEGEIKSAAPDVEEFVQDIRDCRLPLTLHNTGIGLRAGDRDPNWKLQLPGDAGKAARSAVVASVPAASTRYMLDDADHSQWLSSVAELSPVLPGLYVFRSTVDLTGFDPATAVIRVHALADDKIQDVWINGSPATLPPDVTTWEFTEFHTFTLSKLFRDGINTIEFRIPNAARSGMGLRVEWEGTAAPIVQR